MLAEPDGLEADDDCADLDAGVFVAVVPDAPLDDVPVAPGFVDAEAAEAAFGAEDVVVPDGLTALVPLAPAPSVAEDDGAELLFVPSAPDDAGAAGFAASGEPGSTASR